MSVYVQAVLSPDPLYLQPKSYDARSDRKWFADLLSPGIVGAGSYAVTFVSGMTIRIAAGTAYILGQNIPDQGMYREYITSTNDLVVTAANGANPRVDTVILRVMDNAHDSSTFNECRVELVPGAPTAGATLANLNGAANLATLGESSKSVLLLGYVLVPAGAVALTSTAVNIRDARPVSTVGGGSAQGSGFPVGGTLEWNATAMPPDGSWLVEDGSAISRTTYATAFARVGTTFGVGDGSTTWNLPDSRSRVAVGYAPSGGHADHDTIGDSDGLAIGVRRMKHKHTVNDPSHVHGIPTLGGVSGGTNITAERTTAPGSVNTSSATTGITIGPQTGNEPTDSAAYITKNKIMRVA